MEKIEEVNKVLKHFAEDEILQEDLKLEAVTRAIDYWSKKIKLDTDELETLMENRRVLNVYDKFKTLQQVCNRVGLRHIPIEHVIAKQSKLHKTIMEREFGVISPDSIPLTGEKNVAPQSSLDESMNEFYSYTWRSYLLFLGIFIVVFFIVSSIGSYIERSSHINDNSEL
jgi:hypothetical protein